jgi:hypothetical protein
MLFPYNEEAGVATGSLLLVMQLLQVFKAQMILN